MATCCYKFQLTDSQGYNIDVTKHIYIVREPSFQIMNVFFELLRNLLKVYSRVFTVGASQSTCYFQNISF